MHVNIDVVSWLHVAYPSNVQLEGASKAALLLNFHLKLPSAALIVNIYALEIAVGDQRQYVDRRLILGSLAWLAEPRCNRARQDNEGFDHLQWHLASRPITETSEKFFTL